VRPGWQGDRPFGARLDGCWRRPHSRTPGWRRDCLARLAGRLHGFLLIHALTAAWGHAIRPQLVAGHAYGIASAAGGDPFIDRVAHALSLGTPDVAAHLGNRFNLNLQFFLGRGAVYLIVWLGLAGLILRALRQDIPEARLARIAPAGLILLAITVTLRRSTRPCRSIRVLRPAPTA